MKRIVFAMLAPALALPAAARAGEGFTIAPRGRLLVDFANIDYALPGLNRNDSDSEVRTARIGLHGKIGGRFKYVAEFDFERGGDIGVHDPKAKDVKLTYRFSKSTALTIGNQKTPNSLEEQTSGRFTTFLERGTVTDAFALSRRFGAVLSTHGSNYSLHAGAFGNDLNAVLYDHESLFSNQHSYAARATFAPLHGKTRTLHLGASVRRFDGNAGEQIRIRARPRMHLAQRLVDVKDQGENSTLYGLEGAYVRGPFHAEGEWMAQDALTTNEGFFLQAGWFLSGESRPYSVSKGAFSRIKPNRPVGAGGLGAWEIAGRFDTLSLDSTNAGKMETWTLALNWYPQSHTRVMLNAIHANARGNAKFGRGHSDGVQMRLQYDF